ncbi:hypothetical protein B9Z55_008873 [Caenorhabditis nigoni]|uniref:Histone H2A/H2B/H3 domain-containing protein n=1 Tax=Caenorhabditis nigoni TaxID=1611254 RepID=A0A2G5UPP4_9PELO|nr:hypothetical protein B9Z55_008873 [Caenorhabditis nigoni]
MPRRNSNSSQGGRSSKSNNGEQKNLKVQIPENPRIRRHGHDDDTPPATEYLNIQLGRHEHSEDVFEDSVDSEASEIFQNSENSPKEDSDTEDIENIRILRSDTANKTIKMNEFKSEISKILKNENLKFENFEPQALEALRSGAEQFLVDLFEKSQNLVEIDGRNRLEPSNMQDALEQD